MRVIIIIIAIAIAFVGVLQLFGIKPSFDYIQSGLMSICLAAMLFFSNWGREFEGIVNIPNGEIIKPMARCPHPDPKKSDYEIFCFAWGKKTYVDEIKRTSPVLQIGLEYEKVTDGFRRVHTNAQVIIFP